MGNIATDFTTPTHCALGVSLAAAGGRQAAGDAGRVLARGELGRGAVGIAADFAGPKVGVLAREAFQTLVGDGVV